MERFPSPQRGDLADAARTFVAAALLALLPGSPALDHVLAGEDGACVGAETCMADTSLCPLFANKYGFSFVFDVSRNPAFPVAGEKIVYSNLAGPLRDDFTGYDVARGDSVQVEYISGSCPDELKVRLVHTPSGHPEQAEVVSPSGSLYGLTDTGFLYVADLHGVGTYLSNDTAYAVGDIIEVVATTGKVTCNNLPDYCILSSLLYHSCGDANQDDKVTAADALVALKTAVGLESCPVRRCDTNKSGVVDAADALRVLRFAIGLGGTPTCVIFD